MKLTGPACTEALSGAEEAERRERAEGNAGGVRVERRVRPMKSIGIFQQGRMPCFVEKSIWILVLKGNSVSFEIRRDGRSKPVLKSMGDRIVE
jgi:hypothetical protein